MKVLIAHMVAIALLTVIPGNPSECCRIQSWFEQTAESAETQKPSCCQSHQQVAITAGCCSTNQSQPQKPLHAPCECCLNSPDLVVSATTSTIDLNPNVSFIDQVGMADVDFAVTSARTTSVDELPPIAFTELYCVRQE